MRISFQPETEIELLRLIRELAQNLQSHMYRPNTVFLQMRAFYQLQQGPDESFDDFFERLDTQRLLALIDPAVLTWGDGNIGVNCAVVGVLVQEIVLFQLLDQARTSQRVTRL
jgi:hypothetical protein